MGVRTGWERERALPACCMVRRRLPQLAERQLAEWHESGWEPVTTRHCMLCHPEMLLVYGKCCGTSCWCPVGISCCWQPPAALPCAQCEPEAVLLGLALTCSFFCAHRFSEGLEYVRGLSRPEAAASLQKYGKVGESCGGGGVAPMACLVLAGSGTATHCPNNLARPLLLMPARLPAIR